MEECSIRPCRPSRGRCSTNGRQHARLVVARWALPSARNCHFTAKVISRWFFVRKTRARSARAPVPPTSEGRRRSAGILVRRSKSRRLYTLDTVASIRRMTEETTASHPAKTRSPSVDTQRSWVLLGAVVGASLALISLIVGLTMAFQRREAPCPNGHIFAQGTTDFRCFVHPRAGEGSAIAMFAVMLGIIIIFSAVTATGTLNDRTTADRKQASSD